MSIVGIDPNIDVRDIIDEQEEMEIGPDLQTPDYAHYLLGFVRDPLWVPVWRRNRGPRAAKDYSDPPYDPDYDPRSRFFRYRQLEKQPEFNFPLEKFPEKQKEIEQLIGKPLPITLEMEQRWMKKYGPRWKEAAEWLYVYEREDPNSPEDKRSNWEKQKHERELQRAEKYVDFFFERLKMVNAAKKKIQQEIKNENATLTAEDTAHIVQNHVLPPIKDEELIQRGIMDKDDSYEDDNRVFFPWRRQHDVLSQLQKQFATGMTQYKKDQLTTGPVTNLPYDEFGISPHNPYPAISEEKLYQKCGRHLNGLKLCKIMATSRLNPPRNSCKEAAIEVINCMTHQFCSDEIWMVNQHCAGTRGTTHSRICEVSKERYTGCLVKGIPQNSDWEL